LEALAVVRECSGISHLTLELSGTEGVRLNELLGICG